MSTILRRDTLAHHTARPLHRRQSIASVSTISIAKQMRAFHISHPDLACPEMEAITFYGLGHAVSLIQQRRHPLEPLSPAEASVVDDYYTTASTAALRAFCYLTAIATRESRHVKDRYAMVRSLGGDYGETLVDLMGKFSTDNDSGQAAVDAFLASPPDMPFGTYTDVLFQIFDQGMFQPGYGGNPWAAITQCLRRFVMGETSLAIMFDTIWTLSHNNGAIFNKGFLYQCHQMEALATVLDVQRAGMITGLVETPDRSAVAHLITDTVRQKIARARKAVSELPDRVDWNLVHQRGSIYRYESDGGWTDHSNYNDASDQPAQPGWGEDTPQFMVSPNTYVPIAMQRAA